MISLEVHIGSLSNTGVVFLADFPSLGLNIVYDLLLIAPIQIVKDRYPFFLSFNAITRPRCPVTHSYSMLLSTYGRFLR